MPVTGPEPRGYQGPPRIPCTRRCSSSRAHRSSSSSRRRRKCRWSSRPPMLEAGAQVIDLSGAFRLRTPENYKQWYKADHTQPQSARRGGLRAAGVLSGNHSRARLVSNPGCYPTAANLAIRPLIEAGVIDRVCRHCLRREIRASAAPDGSRRSKPAFCEVTENFSAYSILDHRHVPEVLAEFRPQKSASSASPRSCCRSTAAFLRRSTSARPGVDSADDIVAALREVLHGRAVRAPLRSRTQCPICAPSSDTNFCDIGVKFDAGDAGGASSSV